MNTKTGSRYKLMIKKTAMMWFGHSPPIFWFLHLLFCNWEVILLKTLKVVQNEH